MSKDLALRRFLRRSLVGTEAVESREGSLRALPDLVKLGLLLPLFLLTYGYLRYASAAWFHLDDFLFINDFHDGIRWDQLVHPQGFGRFVSINVYWNVTWNLFGREASLYFALNFFLIVATALLLGRLVAKHYGAVAGLVGGVIYFALPNVIAGYTWLANSQHLLAHFFCALFLFLYFRPERQRFTAATIVALEAVLVLALLSNQLASALVVVPVVDLLVNREVRRRRTRWILLGLIVVTVVALYFRVPDVNSGVYSTDLSSSTIQTNIDFYFGSTAVFVLGLVVALAGFTFAAWKRDALHATLFLAGVAFVAPFLVLEFQRYEHYVSLGFACFFIGAWIAAYELLQSRVPQVVPVVALIMVLAAGAFGMSRLSDALETPIGADQRELVAQMRDIVEANGPAVTKYCFTGPNVTNVRFRHRDNPVPSEWWGVGVGNAFRYFVDDSKKYWPESLSGGCDRLIHIEGASLTEVPPS